MPFRHPLIALLLVACSACSTAPRPGDDTRQAVDLIVYGDHLLSMSPGEPVRTDAALAIDDGAIVAVGDAADIDRTYAARETIDGSDRLVMPGLVNGHTHAAMSLLRGVADDLELMTWLNDYIFPAEVALVDADFVSVGTRLACHEMLRGGTTTFVDMYYFPDAVAQTVVDCGMRAVVVPSVIEQPSPDAADGAQSLSQAVDFAARWRDRHARITPAIGAHSVYTISEPWLQRIRDAAALAKAPISIHVSESPFEIQVTQERYNTTPVALLDRLGYLDLPLIAAHVIYPTPDDIVRLAASQSGVIHNPTSNMKIASGVSPVRAMLDAGVRVGLGTDGAASNNDLDMWEEIRLAALLAKVSTMDPTALPARRVLDMATRGGAEAIGLGARIGRLEPGMRADLIQVSLADLDFQPIYDVTSHLVYVADEQDVVTTIVDGRVLMRDGQVLSVDEKQLRADVARIRQRIVDALFATDQAASRNDSP